MVTNVAKWPVSRLLTKSDHRVFSSGLWRALRTHSKHEESRRKALFPPALKRLVEHLHQDGVSVRQNTTERPSRWVSNEASQEREAWPKERTDGTAQKCSCTRLLV